MILVRSFIRNLHRQIFAGFLLIAGYASAQLPPQMSPSPQVDSQPLAPPSLRPEMMRTQPDPALIPVPQSPPPQLTMMPNGRLVPVPRPIDPVFASRVPTILPSQRQPDGSLLPPSGMDLVKSNANNQRLSPTLTAMPDGRMVPAVRSPEEGWDKRTPQNPPMTLPASQPASPKP
jgi:hypothetical protein